MTVLNDNQVKFTIKVLGENIKKHCFVKSDALIKLSSGRSSNFYFDIKKVLGDPQFLLNLVAVYLAQFKKYKIRSVGSIESGSIPIAYNFSTYSFAVAKVYISAFYIKKHPKTYGLKHLTEGVVKSPCIIFEDVITSGNSVIKAVSLLKRAYPELKILGIATVIDRTDDGCHDIKKYTGLNVSSLFKYKSLLPDIKR